MDPQLKNLVDDYLLLKILSIFHELDEKKFSSDVIVYIKQRINELILNM